MQIVTLDLLKSILRVTHSADDQLLTYLANIAEGEILDYCYLADMDAFYAAFGESEVERAALVQAVLYVVDQRYHGNLVNVRGDPHVSRTLLKYRPPELSAGSTS